MIRRLLVVLAGAVLLALTGAAPALADGTPSWRIGLEVSPTHLALGGTGEIVVVASNLGDGNVAASTEDPLEIADTLPEGVTAQGASLGGGAACPISGEGRVIECKLTHTTVNPYGRLALAIKVKIAQLLGPAPEPLDDVSVEGGSNEEGGPAPRSNGAIPLQVSGGETPFGVQEYELSPLGAGGEPAIQAGLHPFQLTTGLVLNQTGQGDERRSLALAKDLRFNLPPGLVGNPDAVQKCTMTDFFAHEAGKTIDSCPSGSVVGVATVTINEPLNLVYVDTVTVPVFDLAPSEGEPARLGFEVLGLVFVVIDTGVRTGSDYGVVASVQNAPESTWLLSSQVTLWGVPGDSRHDASRGWECVEGGHHEKEVGRECPKEPSGLSQAPFLTLPTSCAANPLDEPLISWVEADSWADPQSFPLAAPSAAYAWRNEAGGLLGFDGCEALPFDPSIGVAPQEAHAAPVHSGSAPTGLTVDVKVPQGPTLEPNPEGRAEADVRDTTVTLPEGVRLNPSAANGLEACSEARVGYKALNVKTQTQEFTDAGVSCPEASKVGVVHIRTPLLSKELEGSLFLAEPAPNGEGGKNPFGSLVALYLVAEDKEAGILVKLAGEGKLDQSTGRVLTSFQNTPQLPFEELRVELFGGQRASLSTPASCGDHEAEARFVPWSVPLGSAPTVRFSAGEGFDITEGCSNGVLPFSPGFDAQSQDTSAAALTSFSLQLERPDDDQALTGLSVHLPSGISALLSSVTPCPEPAPGASWACGEDSLIGHSTASSGVGSDPVTLGGDVYLTTGYDGAPFGILDATEARAGPFDLGMVYVRSRIEVNPETAAVTITTDPGPHGDVLPTMLKGVPVALKQLNVTVDRQDFELNPTSCAALKIEGTLDGSEGAVAGVSSPFQVGGCQGLPFKPVLTASTKGQASKANGASFVVRVSSAGLGQANIAKVDLQLPKMLPSRLTTIQKACVAAVFEANPASCDEGSVIGSATIHTPILKNPLSGPAYLVSHGGAAFPDVEFVLQGEGIKLILDGKTQIKEGITYSRFESAPDAPFTSFETVLPAGPHSALTANVAEKKDYDLCGESLVMGTTIVAQDGAVIEQATRIAIEGCGAVKAAKVKKLTRAQQLAKALKACRRKDKRSKSKRVACEKLARKRYVVNTNAKGKKKHAGGKKHG